MRTDIKKKAKAFAAQFNMPEVTLESLRAAIQKQGYTIVEFNNISNSENVFDLLSALDLQALSERSKGFTYADSKFRLVFIHEGLSNSEKLMVLAHEEGHIYCNHLASAPVLGRDVAEEHEANEFAHYLLHRNVPQQISCYVKKHKRLCACVAAAIILLIAGCFIGRGIYCDNTYYGEYYITSTGGKYHDKNCGYVKGKNNTDRLTIEQYENGEYEPCEKCLAD